MLVDELPLIVQAYPRVAGLELHEGGEDEVLSRAVGVLEVLAHHFRLVLVLDGVDVLRRPSPHCVS